MRERNRMAWIGKAEEMERNKEGRTGLAEAVLLNALWYIFRDIVDKISVSWCSSRVHFSSSCLPFFLPLLYSSLLIVVLLCFSMQIQDLQRRLQRWRQHFCQHLCVACWHASLRCVMTLSSLWYPLDVCDYCSAAAICAWSFLTESSTVGLSAFVACINFFMKNFQRNSQVSLL